MKKNLSIIFLFVSIVCVFVSSAEMKRVRTAAFAIADLAITKTDSPDPVHTGAILTYTITVTNNGPDAAANASWSDTLPAGTGFVSLPGVAGWSCTMPDPGDIGTVSCSNPSFAVGSAVFTLTVRVAPTVPAGSVLSNTATTTSSTSDGDSGNNSSTATTTVISPATVSGNKSVSGGTTPGSTLSYLVILSNSSASDQQDNPGDEFSDLLGPGLTLVSADATAGIATAAGNTVTWNGVVPAMDSVTITITATINSGTEGQTISNHGTVNYDADGNGTNETSPSTNTVSFVVGASTGNADLGIAKVASADTVAADSDVTYTITVTNNGPDTAANAAMNDPLIGTMTFVSLSSPVGWSCTTPSMGSGGTVNCTNSSLTVASGAQVFTLVGHIPPGTADGAVYQNQATVSTTSTDSTPENNSSTAGTTVSCLTNPVVTTSADSSQGSLRKAIQDACTGGTITFDMTPGHVTSPITLTSAELLINKDLTIQGPGANILTVQRGGGASNFRIFEIANAAITVNIIGMTISNGHAADGPPSTKGGDGGGILNNAAATLNLKNVAISGNFTGIGGADSNNGNNGGSGGGVSNSGTLTIVNSTISGNQTGTGGTGTGGFSVGGSGGSGGGVSNSGTLTLVNSTINSNQTGTGGTGGLVGGSSGNGGGLSNFGTVTIVNSTISGNQTVASLSSFTAGGGGGVRNNSGNTANVRNTIIAGNSVASGGVGPDFSGNLTSQDYNLIGNTSGATITGTTTHNILNQSANLGALANNGGPTQTMLPLPGSPAINAGDTGASLPPDTFDLDGDSDTAEALPLDQRGFARVVGANFDIGAVETNYVFSATAGTPQSTTINTAFATALKATLTESGNAQSGIAVTFTAPASGATGTFPGPSATAVVATNSSGDATAPTFTANGTLGSYNVVAGVGTGMFTANFALTNNNKSNQTISFGALASKTFGDPNFTVSATASSGLPVSFAASGNCTISVATVHITGAGACAIIASQSGDANFNAAAPVPQLFSIAKAATATAVSSSLNPSNLGLSVTFTATVTSTAGTPTGTVQFKDGGTDIGAAQTLNGSGVATFSTTALVTGIHTITAAYGGDANFAVSTGTLSGGQQVGSIIRFSTDPYSTTENSGFTTITVQRIGDLSQAVTVDYATPDAGLGVPCSTPGGVASPRCDFDTTLGTLRFAAGDGASKTFTVLINQDNFVEGPENLTLTLSNLTGGAGFSVPRATTSTATLSIADDVTEGATNPIDDTETFVRTQYHDFLNREADPAGLAFWKNNIDRCNDPANRAPGQTLAQCIEVLRINTSAAFFLSIEFQLSGNLVRSFYVAALDRPATNNMPAFVEFERDTQAVQRGVIVDSNNNAWQAILNANRDAFMKDFVTRAEFVGLYPTTDTPTQYVNKLYLHGVVTPATPAERQAAIDEFAGAGTAADAGARGRALLRITQNTTFQQREMNRSFVQMEYLGYLRRNPNDSPDTNFSGYNFWVSKLNQFNGNFIQAEMVKAFLSSAEYRQRFGP